MSKLSVAELAALLPDRVLPPLRMAVAAGRDHVTAAYRAGAYVPALIVLDDPGVVCRTVGPDALHDAVGVIPSLVCTFEPAAVALTFVAAVPAAHVHEKMDGMTHEERGRAMDAIREAIEGDGSSPDGVLALLTFRVSVGSTSYCVSPYAAGDDDDLTWLDDHPQAACGEGAGPAPALCTHILDAVAEGRKLRERTDATLAASAVAVPPEIATAMRAHSLLLLLNVVRGQLMFLEEGVAARYAMDVRESQPDPNP